MYLTISHIYDGSNGAIIDVLRFVTNFCNLKSFHLINQGKLFSAVPIRVVCPGDKKAMPILFLVVNTNNLTKSTII